MIQAETKTITTFFSEGALIIPDYQRQYSWGKEQVETLWSDLFNFFRDTENRNGKTYFLGNIIYSNLKDKDNYNVGKEIIDGQQRITTLMLILNCLQKVIENSITYKNDSERQRRQQYSVLDIERLLWQSNGKGEEACSVPSKREDRIPILDSKVYLSTFTVFKKLLMNKIIKEEDFEKNERKSPYYKNYVILQNKIETLKQPDFIPFVNCLLKKVNFAVISADDFGEAIDVFSNLNSKGIPLTDIDVFKAYILRSKDDKDKKEFSDWWNTSLCNKIKEAYGESKIDDVLTELFTIYQYHLLALERKGGKEEKANIPKLRNYFMENDASRLEDNKRTDVKSYLEKYLDFQKRFDNTRTLPDNDWLDIKDMEIRKLLDILSYHPYKIIKRPVCIYYIKYKDTEKFQEKFKKFLKKYIVFVVGTYIYRPDTDSLKNEIIPLIINILESDTPDIKNVNMENIVFHIREDVSNKDLIRALLAIYAYSFNEQKTLLPWTKKFDWQIEHIFPKKWKTLKHEAELNENEDFGEKIQDYIELIGNKMPLEQDLNNHAKNEYLLAKLEFYRKSGISAVSEMCNLGQNEQRKWYTTGVLDAISRRGEKIAEKIKSKFEEWIDQYSKQ